MPVREKAVVLGGPLDHNVGLREGRNVGANISACSSKINSARSSESESSVPFPRMGCGVSLLSVSHKLQVTQRELGLTANALKDFRVQQLVLLTVILLIITNSNEHTHHLGIFLKMHILAQ